MELRQLGELAHLRRGRPLLLQGALLADRRLQLLEAREEVRQAPISEAALSDKAQRLARALEGVPTAAQRELLR